MLRSCHKTLTKKLLNQKFNGWSVIKIYFYNWAHHTTHNIHHLFLSFISTTYALLSKILIWYKRAIELPISVSFKSIILIFLQYVWLDVESRQKQFRRWENPKCMEPHERFWSMSSMIRSFLTLLSNMQWHVEIINGAWMVNRSTFIWDVWKIYKWLLLTCLGSNQWIKVT